jgi:hypothetical protein
MIVLIKAQDVGSWIRRWRSLDLDDLRIYLSRAKNYLKTVGTGPIFDVVYGKLKKLRAP